MMSAREPADAAPDYAQRTDVARPPALLLQRQCKSVTLHWSDGRSDKQVFVSERSTIGSASGVTIRVQHPTVSRCHAEVEPGPDGVWIRDLASTNGVYVDGVRIREACLHDGARLQLGAITLAVRGEQAPASTQLWPEISFGPLLGRSEVMRELFMRLSKVSAREYPVLIEGESGTGKDLVARAIHANSRVKDGPFIIVDCGALSPSLTESTLFGHERGAFTGADSTRKGAIAAADGGTLFLDEIGELPLELQPKLLRAVQEGTYCPIGATEYRKSQVRFLAATHRDLRRMVNEDKFREDLYFRLSIIPIRIPPLRERLDDIPLLVESLRKEDAPPFDDAVIRRLTECEWRGNVRQLISFVARVNVLGLAFAFANLNEQEGHGSGSADAFVDIDLDWKAAMAKAERLIQRTYLTLLKAKFRGDRKAMAKAMGVSERYLRALLEEHGL